MSIYLSNRDVGPIGSEVVEFLDELLLSDAGPQNPSRSAEDARELAAAVRTDREFGGLAPPSDRTQKPTPRSS